MRILLDIYIFVDITTALHHCISSSLHPCIVFYIATSSLHLSIIYITASVEFCLHRYIAAALHIICFYMAMSLHIYTVASLPRRHNSRLRTSIISVSSTFYILPFYLYTWYNTHVLTRYRYLFAAFIFIFVFIFVSSSSSMYLIFIFVFIFVCILTFIFVFYLHLDIFCLLSLYLYYLHIYFNLCLDLCLRLVSRYL